MPTEPRPRNARLLAAAENTATLGMILICAGLMIPLFNITDPASLTPFKWVYAAGALIFASARAAGAARRSLPRNILRLHRMEFWGGVAFIIGAALWFYQERHLGPNAGSLSVVRNTILFTLVGAVVQIVAAWLIHARTKGASDAPEGKEKPRRTKKND